MDGVDTRHRDYSKFSPKWKRCRDASDGQDAVHAAAEAYLPKLKEQEAADYTAYKLRAGFYNATWRTLGGLLGMLFRKSPAQELPGAVDGFTSDIDMAGTTLETFARRVALEVMEVGRVGIMVDHPEVAFVGPRTLAAVEAMGLRPMLKTYRAECITNWKYGRVANHWKLIEVRLFEMVSEPDGEWGEKQVEQYRVLELVEGEGWTYQQRLFRRRDGDKGEFEQYGEPIVPLMGNRPLAEIPFVIVGSDGIDAELDEPPLIDLVDVNLSHYRTNADYEHGCHFTGCPTLFLSGFGPDDTGTMPTFYIGSQAAIVAPHPDAKGMFIEFTGQGLNALKDNLQRKEEQMAILGARMLFAEKRGVEAAETASIHRQGEASVLASIATAVSDAMEWALGVFSQWAGASGPVVYQLNRDFAVAGLDAQQIVALLKLVQSGEMSSESLFGLLQRNDVVDSELTFEEEQERIGKQEPVRPAPAANDGLEAAA